MKRALILGMLVVLVSLSLAHAQASLTRTLAWDPPATFTDGSPIQPGDIQGYRLYGSLTSIPDDADRATLMLLADVPGTQQQTDATYVPPGATGTLFVRASAYGAGGESALSNEVAIAFDFRIPGPVLNLRIIFGG